MKIGMIAESLRKTTPQAIAFARKIGAEGVQLYAQEWTEAERKEILSACKKNKVAISAICADVSPKSFQVRTEAPLRVRSMKSIVDIAVSMKVKILTTHVGHIPESKQDPVYPIMVEHVREAAEYAYSNGCIFAIETGPELADVLKTFIEEVGSKGLGVNLDPANLRGVSCEDPVYAVKTLAPYIVHTHAKDSINTYVGSPAKFYGLRNPDGTYRDIAARASGFQEVPLGKGMVPWKKYIAALREIGYDGFLTIERECGEDPAGDIKLAADFLKDLIG